MAFTYDPNTDAGKVRLLVRDTDTVDVDRQVNTDDEIDAFLAIEGGKVYQAAAACLESIAANEAQVLKVIKNLDLDTDGAKLAKELREQAAQWRKRSDELDDEGATDEDDIGFAVAEFIETPSQLIEKLTKEAIRTGG